MTKQLTFVHSNLTKIIHAISAILILGLFGVGTFMAQADDSNMKAFFYKMHTFSGMLLVILTIIRIYNRIKNSHPVPDKIDGVNKILYSLVHWAIYIVLLLIGMSGMGTMVLNNVNFLSIEPANLNRELFSVTIHQITSKLILLFIFLHVAGVFRYQFTKGNVLARMDFRKSKSMVKLTQ